MSECTCSGCRQAKKDRLNRFRSHSVQIDMLATYIAKLAEAGHEYIAAVPESFDDKMKVRSVLVLYKAYRRPEGGPPLGG